MKINNFWFVLSALFATIWVSCDDNTEGLGESMIPEEDVITVGTKKYNAYSRSLLAGDSILARTSTAYLGRYTDPFYGTFEADFLAQFHCVEGFQFPDGGVVGDSAIDTEVRLYLSSHFGASDNPSHLVVYPLDSVLQEGQTFYTDIIPEDYYDESQDPIAGRAFTADDQTIPDSVSSESDFVPYISVKLPREFGTQIIRKYYEKDAEGNHIGKANFANAEAFINNVCKGLYFKCDQGDGTILNVMQAQLNVKFSYLTKSSSGNTDSAVVVLAQFAATQEVIQANRFSADKEVLRKLVEEDGSCTYLKTPAGIFTEVTLPLDEIANNHVANGDTLNSIKLTFTRYNERDNDAANTSIRMGIPKTLLMVRKKDMYTFFEKNSVTDNLSSYLAYFDESSNNYSFNNIAQLVTTCINEKRDANGEVDEDWDKVVLIPVVTTSDNSGSVVTIRHDLGLKSARLMGGFNPGNELQVRITYSKFQK